MELENTVWELFFFVFFFVICFFFVVVVSHTQNQWKRATFIKYWSINRLCFFLSNTTRKQFALLLNSISLQIWGRELTICGTRKKYLQILIQFQLEKKSKKTTHPVNIDDIILHILLQPNDIDMTFCVHAVAIGLFITSHVSVSQPKRTVIVRRVLIEN